MNRLAVLLAFVFVLGCEDSPPRQVADALAAKASAVYSICCVEQSQADPTPIPDGPEPGDTCPNCNGRGKIGDGRTMVECGPCDGTGVVQGQTADESEADSITESPASEAVVVMISQPNCPPCERWWRDERPKWEASGWTVLRSSVQGTGFAVTPSFVLKNGDKTLARHEGYLTTATGWRLLENGSDSANPVLRNHADSGAVVRYKYLTTAMENCGVLSRCPR